MKRRDFTFGLAALTAAPALPLPALSATARAGVEKYFFNAKLIARAHNHCSTEMLSRLMRLSQSQARDLYALLLEKGVVTPPVAGVSMATNPMNTHCVPKEALKPTNIAQSVSDIQDRVKDLMEKHRARLAKLEEIEDTPVETPEPNPTPEPET